MEVAVTFSTLYGELAELVVVELVATVLVEVELAIDALMQALFKVEGERMVGEAVVVGGRGERAMVGAGFTSTLAPPWKDGKWSKSLHLLSNS